jgi:hypothetical protein
VDGVLSARLMLMMAFAVAAQVARADSSPPASTETPPSPYIKLVRDSLAPDPRIEWEVDVQLPKAIPKQKILRALSGLLRAKLYAQVMGPGKERWESLRYTDEERFQSFAVVKELYGQVQPITVEDLQELEKITQDAARALGGTARTPRTPEEALATSARLAKMKEECSLTLWLIVSWPSEISRDKVWSVLAPLDWHDWGDQKRLVWRDRSATRGGEEQMSAGPFGTYRHWAFWMTVPRARDPVAAFERLRESAEQVAKALGGSIAQLKTPYDPAAMRAQVKSVAACVKAAGFDLGESAVLRMF